MNKTWGTFRVNVYQVTNHIWIIRSSRYRQLPFSWVEPFRNVALSIKGSHKDVDVEISSEDMLMWVDEVVRKLVANIVKGSLVVYFTAEEVINTIEAALEREIRLFSEIDRFLILHKNKYILLNRII